MDKVQHSVSTAYGIQGNIKPILTALAHSVLGTTMSGKYILSGSETAAELEKKGIIKLREIDSKQFKIIVPLIFIFSLVFLPRRDCEELSLFMEILDRLGGESMNGLSPSDSLVSNIWGKEVYVLVSCSPGSIKTENIQILSLKFPIQFNGKNLEMNLTKFLMKLNKKVCSGKLSTRRNQLHSVFSN